MSLDQLNEIINEIKTIGFHNYEEALQNEVKFYTFQKYQIVVQLIVKKMIEIDFYAELKGGYYEIGDVNIIANKINSLNEFLDFTKAFSFNASKILFAFIPL